MNPELILLIVIVTAALLFDFFNGFNDAANSIATIVATQVLTPLQAVAWAAFFNFAAFFLFGTSVAKTVGGGVCGPAPSSLVASAALQLAWSRYLGDVAAETGDPDMALKASRLAEASRQSLLAAHELCAKEALARPNAKRDPLAAFMPKETDR